MELAVERLCVAILHRLACPDEIQLPSKIGLKFLIETLDVVIFHFSKLHPLCLFIRLLRI